MMLSREAIISIRPPLHIEPNQESFTGPQKQWLGRQWHIAHSTQPERYSPNEALSPMVMVATDESKSPTVYPASTNPDSPTVLFLDDKTTTRKWEILAWGKEGQLESWMIEDGSGWISDTSGERRADWRNSYVVVFISDTLEQSASAVEIWERFNSWHPLSDETVGKIRDALDEVACRDESKEFGALVERLKPVRTSSK